MATGGFPRFVGEKQPLTPRRFRGCEQFPFLKRISGEIPPESDKTPFLVAVLLYFFLLLRRRYICFSALLPALLRGGRRELEPGQPRGTPGLSQAQVCGARAGLGAMRQGPQAAEAFGTCEGERPHVSGLGLL